MESRLQQRLRERREQAALAGIGAGLTRLYTGRGLTADEAPGWVDGAVQGFWSVFAEPAEVLTDEAAPEALDAWIEGLLSRHGVVERVYLASHLRLLPWLECRVPAAGWMAEVRAAVGDPWIFLSSGLDTVVAVAEAEYRYEAYVARSDGVPGEIRPVS